MTASDTVIYAIGDVHGESHRLGALHAHILEHHEALYADRQLKLVHLGDYVDRGPDSVGVIEALMQMQQREDIECVCLRGNHEAMMISALADSPSMAKGDWLHNGGRETMESYERRGIDEVPVEHLDWLQSCPTLHVDQGHKLIFVHAGIAPDKYPHEDEMVRLWTRSKKFFNVDAWANPELEGWTVVHGHTPTDDFYPEHVQAAASRLNIDTGAVFGGRLTAAVFADDASVRFMYT